MSLSLHDLLVDLIKQGKIQEVWGKKSRGQYLVSSCNANTRPKSSATCIFIFQTKLFLKKKTLLLRDIYNFL